MQRDPTSAARAVIDLGTNTFHLLGVRVDADGRLHELLRQRRFVFLASEGIEHIGQAAFERAMATMQEFAEALRAAGITRVRALGTAALRTADNGRELIRAIAERTGIHTELIDGREEARLIHRGVTAAVPRIEGRGLIMDIGGGSVEFILVSEDRVLWAESYPIGIAVLRRRFHRSDPLGATEETGLRAFLRGALRPLAEQLTVAPAKLMLGASGTFDVIGDLLPTERSGAHFRRVAVSAVRPFIDRLRSSTLQTRLGIPGLPKERAELIVVALLLIEEVLALSAFEAVEVSDYAMKEGALLEMGGG